MGFFSEIKKLLWTQKAVAKSAANKTADAAKEKGEELMENADEFFTTAKDKATDLGSDLYDKAGDGFSTAKDFANDMTEKAWDKAAPMVDKMKDFTEDLGEKVMEKAAPVVDKTKSMAEDIGDRILGTAENVGGEVLEKGNTVGDKAASFSENVGEKVLETGGKVMDKTKDIAEDLGGKILEKGGEIWEKAQEMGGTAKGKFDDLVDHADKVAKGEETMESLSETAKKINDKLNKPTELSGKIGYEDTKGSLLDDTDDFFSKASKYASGDYNSFSEGKTEIVNNTPSSVPKDPFQGDIHGFDDTDGDGDPLIDDAIIEDDPK